MPTLTPEQTYVSMITTKTNVVKKLSATSLNTHLLDVGPTTTIVRAFCAADFARVG